jgi:hypothetical protein
MTKGFTTKHNIEINLIPVTVSQLNQFSLNGMQNLREHQLSSVCLVVPLWLAVK